VAGHKEIGPDMPGSIKPRPAGIVRPRKKVRPAAAASAVAHEGDYRIPLPPKDAPGAETADGDVTRPCAGRLQRGRRLMADSHKRTYEIGGAILMPCNDPIETVNERVVLATAPHSHHIQAGSPYPAEGRNPTLPGCDSITKSRTAPQIECGSQLRSGPERSLPGSQSNCTDRFVNAPFIHHPVMGKDTRWGPSAAAPAATRTGA